MAASQNGWRANDRSVISTRQVQGSNVKLAVRNGAPGDLLLMVAAAYDRFVDDIDAVADDWGYAERPIRGKTTELSNHASGTAIDLDATEHPLATDPHANFSAAQIAKIREIIGVTGNVVRWGGDYDGRKDGMHFEINDGRTEADCARALEALRKWFGSPASAPVIVAGPAEFLRKGSRSDEVKRWQNYCNKMYSRFRPPLVADGVFGDATDRRTREIQQFLGLDVDGVVGPRTKSVTKF